jgi:cephalosporin-C deacetylase
MPPRYLRSLLLSLAVVSAASSVLADSLVVAPDQASGVYRVGASVRWTVTWDGKGTPPAAHYKFLKGQLTETGQGDLAFSQGAASLETTFEGPGTMLAVVTWKSADGKEARAVGGAVAAPDQIALSAAKPADFGAFWKAKLQELAQVPMDPQVEAVDVGVKGVSYWKVTLANIRGSHIYGQLARPSVGTKFPALLVVQWAGVYGLKTSWATDHAAQGWLVLNIEPHDLPIDRPDSFYKDQSSEAGPLHNYNAIGNDNRETSYFLRMYLSCYRAVDYLKSRPDWDGHIFVVTGGSQGGQQTLMTAGFHPGITAALAVVPAGCDMLGPDVGRRGGWPQWYGDTKGKDPAKVHEASRYFDVANFTPSITCPVLVGLGLVDETCPAAGILAAMNQVSSPKEVVIMAQATHQENHAEIDHRLNDVWLPALLQGKSAPVAH